MITIQGGAFQYPDGGVIANGTMVLRLSWDSTETVTNPFGTVVAGEPISIPLDSDGNLTPTLIWGNSELSISTYYEASLYNSAGVPLLKTPIIWIFTESSGAVVNVGDVPNQGNVPGNTLVPVKGDKGDKGDQGIQGIQGPPGTFNSPTPPVKVQFAAITYPSLAPTVVQHTASVGTNPTVTLTSFPTVGNTLFAFAGASQASATLPVGFTLLTNYGAVGTYGSGAVVGYRVVQGGDGKSWAFGSGGNHGDAAIIEVQGTGLSITSHITSGGTEVSGGSASMTTASIPAQAALIVAGFYFYFVGSVTFSAPTEFVGGSPTSLMAGTNSTASYFDGNVPTGAITGTLNSTAVAGFTADVPATLLTVSQAGAAISAVFPYNPTPGNLLVLQVTTFSTAPMTTPLGFDLLSSQAVSGIQNGYAYTFTRTVQVGDGKTWNITRPDASPIIVTLGELENANTPQVLSGESTINVSVGTATLGTPNTTAGCVVMVQCLNNNTGTAFMTAASPAFYNFTYVPSTVINSLYGSFSVDGNSGFILFPSGTIVPNQAIIETFTNINSGIYQITIIPGSLVGGSPGAEGPAGPPGASSFAELLFLGYYEHGDDISVAAHPSKYVSPFDSYVYTQNQVLYYQLQMVSTRSPATGFVSGQTVDPGQSGTNPENLSWKLWFLQQNVVDNPSGFNGANYLTVYLFQGYTDGNGNERDVHAGYCRVYAMCQRS